MACQLFHGASGSSVGSTTPPGAQAGSSTQLLFAPPAFGSAFLPQLGAAPAPAQIQVYLKTVAERTKKVDHLPSSLGLPVIGKIRQSAGAMDSLWPKEGIKVLIAAIQPRNLLQEFAVRKILESNPLPSATPTDTCRLSQIQFESRESGSTSFSYDVNCEIESEYARRIQGIVRGLIRECDVILPSSLRTVTCNTLQFSQRPSPQIEDGIQTAFRAQFAKLQPQWSQTVDCELTLNPSPLQMRNKEDFDRMSFAFFQNARIDQAQQDKHIAGSLTRQHNAHLDEKNLLLPGIDPKRLLKEFAGKGIVERKVNLSSLPWNTGYRELFIAPYSIGMAAQTNTGAAPIETNCGVIHYDKNGGAHIVPVAPFQPSSDIAPAADHLAATAPPEPAKVRVLTTDYLARHSTRAALPD